MRRIALTIAAGLAAGVAVYAAGWWLFIDTLPYVEQADAGMAHFLTRLFALAGGGIAAAGGWAFGDTT